MTERQYHYQTLPKRLIKNIKEHLEEYLYDVRYVIIDECKSCHYVKILWHYIV